VSVRPHITSKMTAIGAIALLAIAAVTGTAGASSVVQTSVVSANPADFTPRVITGTAVYKLLQVGSTMFAGGDFTQVQNSARTTTFNRTDLFSFDATTGAVNSLSATFDGAVWGLASDGSSLWVGGTFKNVNGVARRGLVKLNATTGVVDPAFNANFNGNVEDVQLVSGRLIVGGKFTKALQAVDPATGADTGYLNLSIGGTVATNAGATDIYRFAVNPAGTRLVAIGNFTSVSGSTRFRAFMLNLGATSGTLSTWYYTPLNKACRAATLPAQLRDVDFSPDGVFFVIVATGNTPQPSDQGIALCDAAFRFETGPLNPPASTVSPTWKNYTGGDTLHSVAVTKAAVYVQGHERWVGSTGVGCTPGCSARPGIAALSPSSGAALSWNPTKDRGVGGKDLLLTTAGLWVASDTTHIGGETHERVAFMPLP
jgi:glutamine cyclotransferase